MRFNRRPEVNRRQAMAIGLGGVAGASLIGLPVPALADKKETDEIIAKFTAGKTPTTGKVKLEVPEIAENGNTVPLAVSVESPMTAASHVTEVLVLADGNPRPGVATFRFSPASGVAEASTRIRLASTQNIVAIAKMNDGSVFMDSKQVKVTIGGCGG